MDVRSAYDPDLLAADLALDGALLAEDRGLKTAIVLSLFSDRRALVDDPLPFAASGRRGWWGDALPPVAGGEVKTGDRIGSRLWLLSREKQTADVVARAREYAAEAVVWLTEDGIAERVDVKAEIVRDGVLGIAVTVRRPDAEAAAFRSSHVWASQAGAQ